MEGREMRIEILFYLYLGILFSMIFFNIACIFVFKYTDYSIIKQSNEFINLFNSYKNKKVDEKHLKIISKKLLRVNNLQAFDMAMEKLAEEDKEALNKYLIELTPVFIDLTIKYHGKEEIQAAYFPYIIKKYKLFKETDNKAVLDTLLDLVSHYSVYTRENALEALYSTANAEAVVKALHIIDKNNLYHNNHLLHEGLLTFEGDEDELANRLWQDFYEFKEEMQVSFLNYFSLRKDGGKYCDLVIDVMNKAKRNSETYYACLKYYEAHPEPKVYEIIKEQLRTDDYSDFVCRSLCAKALGCYNLQEAKDILIELLHDKNWYVRNNAAKSLEKQNVEYLELIDIFEGSDRYARDMMNYSLMHRSLREKQKYADQG